LGVGQEAGLVKGVEAVYDQNGEGDDGGKRGDATRREEQATGEEEELELEQTKTRKKKTKSRQTKRCQATKRKEEQTIPKHPQPPTPTSYSNHTDTQIIRRAVSGMLPKNTFRDRRLARLKIFPGEAPAAYKGNVLKTWRDEAAKTVRESAEAKQ